MVGRMENMVPTESSLSIASFFMGGLPCEDRSRLEEKRQRCELCNDRERDEAGERLVIEQSHCPAPQEPEGSKARVEDAI